MIGKFGLAALVALMASAASAQKTTSGPVTDSAAQSSPIQPAPPVPAVDAAAEASPLPDPRGGHAALPANTAIPIALSRAIDSGRLKNGDTVTATLRSPISLRNVHLAAGTPVQLTVVATVPAGKINAAGEFSLQVMRVGSVDVFTDTQTFRGQPGHKDLPDSAPAVGTDAGLASGAPLTFHVQPPPVAAGGPPAAGGTTPGSVTGRASGGPPPAGSSAATQGGTSNSPGKTTQNQPTVAPANTTTRPIHGNSPSPASAPAPQ